MARFYQQILDTQRAGPREDYGYWLMTGLWFAEVASVVEGWLGPVETGQRWGLYVPVGLELTTHFGDRLNWVFGLRLYWAPLVTPLEKTERTGFDWFTGFSFHIGI